jgi:predicted RNA polymerase sigma factor
VALAHQQRAREESRVGAGGGLRIEEQNTQRWKQQSIKNHLITAKDENEIKG